MVNSNITIVVAAAIFWVLSCVQAVPFSPALMTRGESGITIALVTGSICLMLPPNEGGDIAESEDTAIAFCQNPSDPSTPGAKLLPDDFIQSSHFVENKEEGWIQVTGRMNRDSYQLESTDEGGQYDTKAPKYASCAGYKTFVQITEPSNNIYCLRCCQSKEHCPVNRSTHGCVQVLPGDYS
ncbi:hypothetical protein BGZ83_008493 [Gryganskiella cystojenkinii]|nr:hypothetical protein BGZ83_008493 [Gryganskiella cystojenkinii]